MKLTPPRQEVSETVELVINTEHHGHLSGSKNQALEVKVGAVAVLVQLRDTLAFFPFAVMAIDQCSNQ